MSFSSIRSKIRAILNENTRIARDVFTFTNSRVFSLTEENAQSITDVLKNDVTVPESGNWSYSSTTNKITFQGSVLFNEGDTVEFDYTYYPNYSDAELNGYIQASLAHICVNQYKTFEIDGTDINPEPCEAEENLIALVASILIRPDNKSYRLPDMSISVPTRSLPTDDIIRKAIASFKKDTHGVFSTLNKHNIII